MNYSSKLYYRYIYDLINPYRNTRLYKTEKKQYIPTKLSKCYTVTDSTEKESIYSLSELIIIDDDYYTEINIYDEYEDKDESKILNYDYDYDYELVYFDDDDL